MNLHDELLAVRAVFGSLTPDSVLESARDEASPLHSRFQWDDALAGESWRRHQAHELIRSVRVKRMTADPNEPQSVRAFQAVRGTDDRTYVYEPSAEIATDPLISAMVLRDMEREWKQLRRRYEAFDQFVAMVRSDLDENVA